MQTNTQWQLPLLSQTHCGSMRLHPISGIGGMGRIPQLSAQSRCPVDIAAHASAATAIIVIRFIAYFLWF
jgi:hypothetical protein